MSGKGRKNKWKTRRHERERVIVIGDMNDHIGTNANEGQEVRLREVGQENFQVDLSEESWENENQTGVVELNECQKALCVKAGLERGN